MRRHRLRETAPALRDGTLDLATYLSDLCGRIDELNPRIFAFLPEPGRRERLLAEAEALQRAHPDPSSRPPLYGVPVGVKDVFRVDGMETRAGSALPPDLFAGPQAAAVTLLRRAGALVLGKTVTTEFAQVEPGPARNPHNFAHTPGGSSSGSAAAVAAGLAPLALGTQTVGSVIRPAAFCGVAGYKPSFGRVPAEGTIFCSPSLDHVGFYAQDAAGLALAASVLVGGWQPGLKSPGYEAEGAMGSMPVIGVPEGAYIAQAAPNGLRAFEAQLTCLERAGCVARRVPALDDIASINERHIDLMAAEFAEVHRDWFDAYGPMYRPRTAALVEQGRAVSAERREAGGRSRAELRARLQALMDEHGIDVWASPPAAGTAPEGLLSTGLVLLNLPWTHAGMPAVSLPAGRADGLPFGLQLSARFGDDERLLAYAGRLEPVLGSLGEI